MRSLVRWGRSRFSDRALILGYHRIASPAHDPFQLSVSPENFRRHLHQISATYKPVSLSDLVAGLREGTVEPGSVVLTFDDAYRETLSVAQPILAEFEMPATVFVATSTLGKELWWDKLQRLLMSSMDHRRAEGRERVLEIRAGGFRFEGAMAPEGDRVRFLTRLYRGLLHASSEDRKAALRLVGEWVGPMPDPPTANRVLTKGELLELAGRSRIEIGSHSVSHPMMARLSREEQEDEIMPSRIFLEEILGRSVEFFSYPNGSQSPTSRHLVEDAGFLGACGSLQDVVTAQADRFLLPRFWPSDAPNALAGPLHRWLGSR